MTRALYAIAGLAIGALFFPAMSATMTALAVLHAAISGGL